MKSPMTTVLSDVDGSEGDKDAGEAENFKPFCGGESRAGGGGDLRKPFIPLQLSVGAGVKTAVPGLRRRGASGHR